jgi:sulfur transfer complex TusBCD TusB component (DsrH family)
MRKIIAFWSKYFGKERKLQDEQNELKRGFQVHERNGKLYLVDNGVAFACMDDSTTAQAISSMLAEARKVAVEYKQN